MGNITEEAVGSQAQVRSDRMARNKKKKKNLETAQIERGARLIADVNSRKISAHQLTEQQNRFMNMARKQQLQEQAARNRRTAEKAKTAKKS